MSALPPQLQRVYSAFPRCGVDVEIMTLYRIICPWDTKADECVRDAQQRLGPYIVRLNRRLRSERRRITPGVARRTYRLTAI